MSPHAVRMRQRRALWFVDDCYFRVAFGFFVMEEKKTYIRIRQSELNGANQLYEASRLLRNVRNYFLARIFP